MSDASALMIQTAGLGDTLGTLLFLVVFFIAPVIKQVLSERKKQATLDESRRKREERQPGEPAGMPDPLDVDDEPTPPFPWEMVEVQDVAPPEPRPVRAPMPVPVAMPEPEPVHAQEHESIVTISHSPLTDADWGHLQDAPQEPEPISPREARRMLERRKRRSRVNWRRAIVTAELLAPPVALRGPGAGSGPGLGAPAALG